MCSYVAIGTKQTYSMRSRMSAFGGKADIDQSLLRTLSPVCRKKYEPLRHIENDIDLGTWLGPEKPLIGYMRVSKADGSQVLDLQKDALLSAGVSERHLYSDAASGKKDDRPGLSACLQALRDGDTLVVWKLERLGRSLRHLVNVVHDLTSRGVGLRVLTGQGAAIDTTTPAGKLIFGIFASLAEFERDLISERTRAGLASARARGRKGGRRPKLTPAKLRLAMAAMGKPETNVGDLCRELGITRSTLYRHVSPTGKLRRYKLGTSGCSSL
jgi:DNA invertase Pin-like site-specific DNA recombinase